MRPLKTFFLIAVICLMSALAANAQNACPEMPIGFLCISQNAGNKAAENVRELAAKDSKIEVLESALTAKDKIADDIRQTASRNEADLRRALHATETELASKTGQLIGAEAANVRYLALIDILLKNVRPKKIGLINF